MGFFLEKEEIKNDRNSFAVLTAYILENSFSILYNNSSMPALLDSFILHSISQRVKVQSSFWLKKKIYFLCPGF